MDRIPTDYWSTPEVLDRLKTDLNCKTDRDLWKRLKIDKAHSADPVYVGPEMPHGNIWRFTTRRIEVADGKGVYDEVADCPLAEMKEVEELDDFPWPDPNWFDYTTIPNQLEDFKEWPIRGGSFEPFNLYCSLRGLERAFMDLVEAPEFLEAALQRIFEFFYEHNRRIFEAGGGRKGGILFTYVAEDLGSQRGLLMSMDTIERFFIPRMKAMVDLAHSYGVKAFHHDDGAIRKVIPRMIEIGMDVLNPIQWRCEGMEREALKRDFGDALVFHGGMDNQQTVPFGTQEDVRNEVRENIEILGKGGGYILAPCHNLQPVTPTENIVTLYEAVDEFWKA